MTAYSDAVNPAFDITPYDLVTAIVTDRRVIRLDRGERPVRMVGGKGAGLPGPSLS